MLNRFKTLILISYPSPTTLPQTPVFFLKNTYGSLEVCSHHSLWASSPRGFAAHARVVVGLALLAQIRELAHRLQPSCKLHEKRHILCKSKGSYFWFAGGGGGMVTGQIEPCIKCIHLRRHFIETWEGGGGLHCLSIPSTESLPQARNCSPDLTHSNWRCPIMVIYP